jgi:hypothetical protein
MFDRLFGRNGTKSHFGDGPDKTGAAYAGLMERSENFKWILGPVQLVTERYGRKPVSFNPPPFEQIYQTAAVKLPKLTYGCLKVVEMAGSTHLAGMSPEFKRRALLMALEAAGTGVSDVLNDVVIRQRALDNYEEALKEKVKQFEAAQAEQNRLRQEELARLTSQYQARIQANLDAVERTHELLRNWQRTKQQEAQRLIDAAALCVTRESVEEESGDNVMAIPQRATGTRR